MLGGFGLLVFKNSLQPFVLDVPSASIALPLHFYLLGFNLRLRIQLIVSGCQGLGEVDYKGVWLTTKGMLRQIFRVIRLFWMALG